MPVVPARSQAEVRALLFRNSLRFTNLQSHKTSSPVEFAPFGLCISNLSKAFDVAPATPVKKIDALHLKTNCPINQPLESHQGKYNAKKIAAPLPF
jgi:hypothetical protein